MTIETRTSLPRMAPLWLTIGAVVTLAACAFEPSLPEGTIVCSGPQASPCPGGFTCQSGVCRSRPVHDASSEAGNAPDAPVADAPMSGGLDGAGDLAIDKRVAIDGPMTMLDGSADVAPGRDQAVLDSATHDVLAVPDGPIADRPLLDVEAGVDTGAADRPFEAELGPEVASDVRACAPACAPDSTRCGTGGLETCQLVEGCPQWGAAVACAGSKTCQGTEPSAACTCPAAPAACSGGPGTVCEASGVVVSCGYDGDGCMAVLQRTTCPASKPCTGSFPSASCSCPAGPAECQNATGKVCQSASKIATCAIDANGCVALATAADCPVGMTCQGAFPGADCRCPAPPAHCASAGAVCLDTVTLATCTVDANGCVVSTSSACTTGGKVCTGTFPSASCTCPPPPAGCEDGAGSRCSGGSVLTCAADANGCLVAATRTCATGKPCAGAFPSADCACPAAPAYCTGAGTACADGNTLATCAVDGNGCMTASTSSCTTDGKVCTGALPSAACTCSAAPAECSSGAGTSCTNETTQLTCATSAGGCLSATSTFCTSGEYCTGSFPSGACAAPTAVGFYDDLLSQGSHSGNYLFGHRITLGAASVLRRFGLLSEGSANAQLALYKADGTGEPSTLVAYVSGVAIVPGRNEFAPTSPSATPALAAGTYWIFTVFSQAVMISQDTSSTALRRYTAFTYGGGLPTTMPSGLSSVPGPQSNYYILVTPQ